MTILNMIVLRYESSGDFFFFILSSPPPPTMAYIKKNHALMKSF